MTPEQKKALEDQVDALKISGDLKKKLKAAVGLTAAGMADTAAPSGAAGCYQEVATGFDQATQLIQDSATSEQDKDLFTKALEGSDAALRLAQDPATSPEDETVYACIAAELANAPASITAASADQRTNLTSLTGILSAAVLAFEDDKTAPKNAQDKDLIKQSLQQSAQAMTIFRATDASPEDQESAQAVLTSLTGAVQNAQYLELQTELKKYDPSDSCLDAVQARTGEVGWPDGSLWALSDDSCGGALDKAADDNASRWNPVFKCVRDNAFSTCVVTIPEP